VEEPQQWKKIKEIVGAALEREPAERAPFLQEACADDESLRAEVESLLSEFEKSSGLSEHPLFGQPLDPAPLESKSIGPYRLIRKLGEGGMGQVWLAEQAVPVRRQVALKLIRTGIDDQAVLQRFQSERQSLAIMDHPAIAKVFDAGATSEGQPYFVMEYVQGASITAYCDEHQLKIRERLELFLKVCDGVLHAHQKAIIHRDLKPANILVVEVDGKPTPRIIDFGLAKAIGSQTGGETMFTQAGGFVGTPSYMSPEQADPSVRDLDTRTDVYALGVVLYELLTGSLPFDPKKWKEQPLYEVMRQLREQDPPRPSTEVENQKPSSNEAAEKRGTEPKQLASLLQGDLDWITMKALEKDRIRRYGTPSELAADITHYLRNEPVAARPASPGYRLQKYIRRHRVVVAAAAALAFVLVGFTILQAVQLRRTTRERDRANRITDFMTGMFNQSNPSEALGNSITAREVLDKAAKDIDVNLTKDPELQAQMMYVMGNVYRNLGLYSRAQSLLQRAMQIQQRVLGPENPETLKSAHVLANDLDDQGHFAEAEKLHRQTLNTRLRVLGPENPDTLMSKSRLAAVLTDEGHYPEAEKLNRETLDTRSRVLGLEHTDTLASMDHLARLLMLESRDAEAEKLFRETVDIRRRVQGPEHPDTLIAMDNLANVLRDEGHDEEAEKLYRTTIAAKRRVLGPEHPVTLSTINNLAIVLSGEGHYQEAEKLYRETLDAQRRVQGPEHPDTLAVMINLAGVLESEGHDAEAEKLLRETVDAQRRVLGPEHPTTLRSMNGLAGVLDDEHQHAEADKLYRETLDGERRILGPEHIDTLKTMAGLAALLRDEGKSAEAERLYRETNDIQRRVLGPESPDTADSAYNLACLMAVQGRREEAISLLSGAVGHGLDSVTASNIEKDTDLKSLHGDPRFGLLVTHAKERAAVVAGQHAD
jgi:serine/threonine protein kinase/tetratricopeptide (TPR) repeat protein